MIETLPRLFANFANQAFTSYNKGLFNSKKNLFFSIIIPLMLSSSGLLGQSVCTTANNGSTGCSTGNGGTTIATITPTGSWQSVAITSGTSNNYEFNATAGQVYEFATCTGMNMELTIYRYVSASSTNILQYDQNKECSGCTTGCTQGVDDEYAKYTILTSGIHRVRYSRHGECLTTSAAGTLFYRMETRTGCAANTSGTNQWNGYAYNGTNATMSLNYNYGFMQTMPWNNVALAFGEGPATGNCGTTCIDNFCTRWMMNRDYDGIYVFSTPGNDDGRRLSSTGGASWNLFDNFGSGSGTTTINPVRLVGNYDMVYDHREGTGAAGAYLTTCQMAAAGTSSTTGDATDAGTSSWYQYYYNEENFNMSPTYFRGTNSSGSSTTTSATLNSTWSGAPTRIGAVCGTSMNSDFSCKSLLTRSFNKGVYAISSGGDDRSRVRVNNGSWLNVTTSATQTISTDVAINGTTTLEHHMYDTGSGATAVVNFTCQTAKAGTLTSSQNCAGTGTFTIGWTGGEGYYQLQSSPDMATWTDVASELNTAANPTGSWSQNPSGTTFYRVEVISCSTTPVYSNIAAIARTTTTTGNVTISSNITLGGTLTVNGTFRINSGVTVTVKPGCALVVNATDIIVQGTINGNGAGYGGGNGGAGGNAYASCSNDNDNAYSGGKGYGGVAATGTGGGAAGTNGGDANGRSRKCGGVFCSGNSDGYYGGGGGAGGGGGGSYAGAGGNNAYGAGGSYFGNGDNPSGAVRGLGGAAGTTQGTTTGTDISMGFGGGGGGGGGGGKNAGGAGGDGGDGGGSVSLIASNDLTVSGTIACNGTNGGTGGTGSTASDNSYDCSIGNCGSCSACGEETYVAASGAGGGAGGGSGGGIKLQAFGAMSVTGSLSARGGNGGADGIPSNATASCLNSANDGAAGGGGRIKIFTNPCESNVVTPSTSTVTGGTGNSTGGTGTYNINIDHPSYSDLLAGTLSANQSVCNGGIPAAFTGTASTGGTNVYTYNWYSCTTCPTPASGNANPGTGWTSRGTNATGFTETTALTTTTKYVRKSTSGSCIEYSNIITVTVVSDPIWATNTVNSATICIGGTVTFSATFSGGLGGTVSWLRATSPGGAGTTVTSPDAPATAGTYYYRPKYNGTISGCNLADGAETAVIVVNDPTWATNTVSPASICNGGQVTFSATVNNGTAGTITWLRSTTPGGAAATVTSPDAPSSGTFYYRPRYTSTAGGCSLSDGAETQVVVVNDPTWATNTISANSICAGGSVTFSATYTGGLGGTVTWVRATTAGGAGTTVTSPDSPPSTGTYYYRPVYNATASGCNIAAYTERTVIVVNDPTWATNSVSSNAVCLGASVTLTATTSGGTGGTVSWLRATTPGGAGTTVTSPDTPPTVATYYYRPKYNATASGCALVDGTETAVVVSTTPTWATNTVSPNTFCNGGQVTLSATVSGGSGGTVTWLRSTTSGGAAATVTSPDAPSTGTFYYRPNYTSTVTGCAIADGTETQVVVVADPVWASNTISASNICNGGNVTFSATFSGGLGGSISWVRATAPGGAGTTVTSPDTPPSVGTYYYRPVYTGTVSGCNIPTATERMVNVVADPTWTTNSISTNSYCLGGSVTFSATVSGGIGGTVSWVRATSPGGAGVAVTSPDSAPTAGTYYYRPQYTGSVTGCNLVDGTESQVVVAPAATWATNTVFTDSVCVGSSVTFAATVAGGSGGTISWIRSSTPTGTGVTVTSPDVPATTGTYYYRPKYTTAVTSCNLADGAATKVTVVKQPTWATSFITPTLNCAGGIVTFAATVSGGTGSTIIWIRSNTPGGAGSVVTSPDYPATSGTYYYRPRYTSALGCSLADGAEQTVQIVIGLIPNPANPITGLSAVGFGQQGVIYTTTPVANAQSYNWTVPAGAIIVSGQGTTSIEVDFSTALNGSVAVWPINGYCVGDPAYKPVTIANLPLSWTGDVDNAWHVAGNWSSNNVPTASDDVLIPSGRPNYPSTYSANALANKLVIDNGASVTLEPGNNIIVASDVVVYQGGSIEFTSLAGSLPQLRVQGNWIFNGTLKAGKGIVYLDGITPQEIQGNTTFHGLQIENSTGVAVTSGKTYVRGGLNLKDGVLATNGNLTIKSDDLGTGWINDFEAGMNGSVVGNVAVQRFFASTPLFTTFHYISSPVNTPLVASELSELNLYGANNAQLIPTATCNPNGLNYNSPYGSLFEWRENAVFTHNCAQAGWFVRSAGNLTNGRGYAAVIQRTSDLTVEVNGTVNTGNVSYNGLDKTTAIGNGWHMVSNPYPSPIEWNAPAGFVGAAHFWASSGSYTGTYQPVLSGVGAQIPSMQGFFIQKNASPGAANFVMSNSDRRTGDPTFYRQSSWYDHLLTVELAGNNFADKTVVYFGPNCTDEWDDMFDAQKKESRANQPTLYTRITNYGKYVGINGLPTNDSRVVSVPMGMLVGTAGTYTFTFTDMATFAPSALIFLEDLKTGTFRNVRVNDTYTFTLTLADDPERFIIHFYPPATVTSADAGCERNDGTIELQLGMYNIGGTILAWDSYELTDANNNVVSNGSNVNGNINFTNIAEGTYTLSFNIGGYLVSESVNISAPAPVGADYMFGFTAAYTQATLEFINQSTNATYYAWDFGDGNSSTLESPTHTYTAPGWYDVVLVASSDDCDDTYTAKVEVLEVVDVIPVGLSNDIAKQSITIYSYQDLVTVSFMNLNDPKVEVDIFDLTGRKITETQILETSQNRHEIKLSQIASGFYFVRAYGPSSYADKKVFITSDN